MKMPWSSDTVKASETKPVKHLQHLEPFIDCLPFVDEQRTKFDTQKMIDLLLKGIPGKIPAVEMTDFDEPSEKAQVKSSVLLRNTNERKLLLLLHKVYGAIVQTKAVSCKNYKDSAVFFQDETEKHEFFSKIPGLKIVTYCDNTRDSRTCYTYVFENERWFAPYNRYFHAAKTYEREIYALEARLVAKAEISLNFLQANGHKILTQPVVGARVVYFCDGTAQHYAIVTAIDDKGNITVRSKWGISHIWEGPIELVPNNSYNEVVFLS